MTLESIISDAVEELEEWLEEHPDADPTYDGTLHEIADSAVPIYNQDLIELAGENYLLALTEPEIGPAFDGSNTPINLIAANVYEAVTDALNRRYYDWEIEREDVEVA